MSDHDANVAAVLAEHLWNADKAHEFDTDGSHLDACERMAQTFLDALSAENFIIFKTPDDLKIEHGARLVPRTVNLANMEVDLYAIEATP